MKGWKKEVELHEIPHLLVTLTALQAAGWWQGGDYYYYEPIAAWIILWLWPRWQWRLEPENRLELKVIRFTSDFNFILSLLLFPPPRRHSSSSLWIQTSIKSPVLSCNRVSNSSFSSNSDLLFSTFQFDWQVENLLQWAQAAGNLGWELFRPMLPWIEKETEWLA